MIRAWTSDAALWMGKVFLACSRGLSRASEAMADVSEWLATPARWSTIRSRRDIGGQAER
jgi:hypothetical protein